jgi:hypothetical protein
MKKLLLIITIFILIACKKPDPLEDEIIKEIKPNDYFPFYPGSYWTYSNDSNKIFFYASNSYYKYQSYYYKANPIMLNSLENIPISGSSLLFLDNFYNFICTDKKEEYNFKLRARGDFRYNPPTFNYSLKLLGHLDAIDINGKAFKDIFINEFKIVELFSQSSTIIPNDHLLINTINYYAKDVGIILQKKVIVNDSLPNDTIVTRKLVDYRIGAH